MASRSSLARAMEGASRLTSNAKGRHPSSFGGKRPVEAMEDPDVQTSDEEGSELELWRLLPQLRDLPEAMLRKLPVSTMFQLNTALAKEKKTSERLGVNTKLTHNAKKLARTPVEVAKGVENRRDILHPARFLGGASSALVDQWAEARRVIGEGGITAIGNYDLDAVGCGDVFHQEGG